MVIGPKRAERSSECSRCNGASCNLFANRLHCGTYLNALTNKSPHTLLTLDVCRRSTAGVHISDSKAETAIYGFSLAI